MQIFPTEEEVEQTANLLVTNTKFPRSSWASCSIQNSAIRLIASFKHLEVPG